MTRAAPFEDKFSHPRHAAAGAQCARAGIPFRSPREDLEHILERLDVYPSITDFDLKFSDFLLLLPKSLLDLAPLVHASPDVWDSRGE